MPQLDLFILLGVIYDANTFIYDTELTLSSILPLLFHKQVGNTLVDIVKKLEPIEHGTYDILTIIGNFPNEKSNQVFLKVLKEIAETHREKNYTLVFSSDTAYVESTLTPKLQNLFPRSTLQKYEIEKENLKFKIDPTRQREFIQDYPWDTIYELLRHYRRLSKEEVDSLDAVQKISLLEETCGNGVTYHMLLGAFMPAVVLAAIPDMAIGALVHFYPYVQEEGERQGIPPLELYPLIVTLRIQNKTPNFPQKCP